MSLEVDALNVHADVVKKKTKTKKHCEEKLRDPSVNSRMLLTGRPSFTSSTAKCTVALIKDDNTENHLETCYHQFSGIST